MGEVSVMPTRLTTEEFIKRAKKIYGDTYDYSKVDYINQSTRVIIGCPTHGEFQALPVNFLKGHACPICSGREKITPEVFLKRSKKRHNDRYDYSKVEYKGLFKPVCIICPEHGEFWQLPRYHMNGNGCPKCFGSPKSNTEDFIKKAKDIYGDLYDYSKVKYTGNKNKVTIICPKHGEWDVTPNNFLRGSRCPSCYGTPKYTNEEFINKANVVHGYKYDYSKVDYRGNKYKVIIICPEHGEFSQGAGTHLRGAGCPACSGNERITQESFIARSKASHTINYDYSKVNYINGVKKVCIVCPEHGEFWQSPSFHLHGGNCPKCVGGVRLTTAEFIEKAKKVHNNKYDYSKVAYKNTASKVCIICPEHGEFWQTPNNHLFGAGCPTCPQSNLEGEMRNFLLKNNIAFLQEHTFDWLRLKKKLFLDFYLPDYNCAIECQGGQHFSPVDLFGGEDFFLKTLERDRLKKSLCEEHGIKIVYFSNAHIDYPYPVIESYTELLEVLRDTSRAK